MIRAISSMLRERKARVDRHRKALEEFNCKYPDRKSVSWSPKEHALASGEIIQTICFGRTKPPTRSWWMFRPDSDSPVELSHEEVSALIEIPRWL